MMLSMVGWAVGFVPWFETYSVAEQWRRTPDLVLGTLGLELAAAFLLIWLSARDFRVFRSTGIFLFCFGVTLLWAYSGGQPSRWILVSISAPILPFIAAEALQVRRRRWVWILAVVGVAVVGLGLSPQFAWVRNSTFLLCQVVLGILLLQAQAQKTRADARIRAAFFALFLVRGWATFSSVFEKWHLPSGLTIGGWFWSFNSAAVVAFGAAALVIYGQALIADRRAKQALSSELEASRIVQEALIPRRLPATPGFQVGAAYWPFGQVGGDFFQILPLPQDGMLVVIGDVSGKGMPAAITVSLLVGALRMAVEASTRPGMILAALNRALLGHAGGGFTTCLVLHADANGTLTMANAGHIAPYLNGHEVALENGLPLGLATDALYSESTRMLETGEQLTLMTDGVVEARNKAGELYGFERTAQLSVLPAEAIAQAAQAFGQDDDITVLTVARVV